MSQTNAVVQVPLEMIEAIAASRLPAELDQHSQRLMDRNSDGSLETEEREELEAPVELTEVVALTRAKALHLPGRELWHVPETGSR